MAQQLGPLAALSEDTFHFQHAPGGSLPSITPDPKDMTPSLALEVIKNTHGTQIYM